MQNIKAIVWQLILFSVLFLFSAVNTVFALNIDFGTANNVPTSDYGAAAGQAGYWNRIGLGATALSDTSGRPSGASVNVNADFGTGAYGAPSSDAEMLLEDYFYSTDGNSWSANLSGLASGAYNVFVYAPSHPSVPTGDMAVGGVAVSSISGSTGSTLIEGTSWVSAQVTVTDGTLMISGAGASYSGLAGIQVEYLECTEETVPYINSVWPTNVLLGQTPVMTVTGEFDVHTDTVARCIFWQEGSYQGPTQATSITSNQITCPLRSGLAEGETLLTVHVYSLSATQSGLNYCYSHKGHYPINPGEYATFQIAEAPMVFGLNIDLGTAHSEPTSGYGAAAGQNGYWNRTGLGVTALSDTSGLPSGASVNVNANFGTGTYGVPSSDDEMLLEDNFYSMDGNSWSANLSGLVSGAYTVFLYAPSNPSVPTGDMAVGGVVVSSIPGSTGSNLIEGTSWVSAQVTVTDGTLMISGAGASYSGLAGIQVVPVQLQAMPWIPLLLLDE
jgi:hypothetical protein